MKSENHAASHPLANGCKQLEPEPGHLLPSAAVIKLRGSLSPFPNLSSLHAA